LVTRQTGRHVKNDVLFFNDFVCLCRAIVLEVYWLSAFPKPNLSTCIWFFNVFLVR